MSFSYCGTPKEEKREKKISFTIFNLKLQHMQQQYILWYISYCKAGLLGQQNSLLNFKTDNLCIFTKTLFAPMHWRNHG